jgi:hypothetical protein
MELKAGARLASVTCDTQVVVVKAPSGDLDVRCGGEPMVPLGEDATRKDLGADDSEGTLAGKRYTNDDGSIELLCTKAGAGSLRVDGQRLSLKDAKPLPSSD